ncbi:MAG: PAS domain-containing protein, partial [bacterium]|nr:PAS domain-containing protein [bacterium]
MGDLLTEECRAFVDWASTTSRPDGVLHRSDFEPDQDLARWLGWLLVVQRTPDESDYTYRLFGVQLTNLLGQDLTGQPFSVWPNEEAQVLREQADTVFARRAPLMVRTSVLVQRFRDDERKHPAMFEQVLWPMAYSGDAPDAALKLSIAIPAPPR